jgi:hypothetical protein
MNRHEKDSTAAQADLWQCQEQKSWSSKKPVQRLKDLFSFLVFLLTLVIISYFLFGNIEIGKLSFGHNEFLGYYIHFG